MHGLGRRYEALEEQLRQRSQRQYQRRRNSRGFAPNVPARPVYNIPSVDATPWTAASLSAYEPYQTASHEPTSHSAPPTPRGYRRGLAGAEWQAMRIEDAGPATSPGQEWRPRSALARRSACTSSQEVAVMPAAIRTYATASHALEEGNGCSTLRKTVLRRVFYTAAQAERVSSLGHDALSNGGESLLQEPTTASARQRLSERQAACLEQARQASRSRQATRPSTARQGREDQSHLPSILLSASVSPRTPSTFPPHHLMYLKWPGETGDGQRNSKRSALTASERPASALRERHEALPERYERRYESMNSQLNSQPDCRRSRRVTRESKEGEVQSR
eukprot:CAMPEP_0174717114 /NCGR_PEP_ID=MMETSP1094-20130205/25895_1 /TAXON_ID=156173 /ORGANISM="Chrysochromulina brevifilum, Strain UTEX LB 985" /LENGTH=334 /DNA_ID=CAMNT_0015917007 /DNA_START=37 /DNA_END=1038 /DNA_ORIENTATION=-